MSKKFLEINREQSITIELNDCLGKNSLAGFITEIVEHLNTSKIENAYKGGGSAGYPPKMMLSLLFYSYAIGNFSSRNIERSTYELIPVLYITGGTHPDHDTINTFRSRFLGDLKDLFLEILEISNELGVLSLGNINIDGTKIHANASKHKAMSYEYACKLEKRLTEEVEKLFKMSELSENKANIQEIKKEIKYREEKLENIEEIKKKIEKSAKSRYDLELSEYEEKMRAREEKERALGRKLGGRKPTPPEPSPKKEDQVNFTDEDSRIMPISGGGFEQCYNAQAGVETYSLMITNNHVSQKPNDKQEIKPNLEELDILSERIGNPDGIAADNGFFSEENINIISSKGIKPYISLGRESHNKSLEELFEKLPEKPENASPLELMRYSLKTEEGKEIYAQRKSTIEPVFGIIKEVMGFRRFMLRGLKKVTGEWNLVCLVYNLKRLCKLLA